MRCLIVDDEPLAQNILEKYIHQLSELMLVGKCDNAFQAIAKLQTQQIDLLLLDIQMPEISGFDMLRNLQNPPLVIFTTAFSDHALLAFDLNALDYLLKPITFERFARAINKAKRYYAYQERNITITNTSYIFLKSDRKLHKVFLSDILFIEGLSNYLKVYMPLQMLVVREKMGDMENLLLEDQFIRVHKSFIVAIEQIDYTEGNIITIGKYQIPIGDSYRQAFYKRLGRE
jgi:DNA-binding LytR/AlgR family response regulator